jgi:predicted nucleotidyltransferase
METIKYKLSRKKNEFLQNMQEYLNTKLYFYGSIQRFDYIDNVSDIDICIFTDNMDSTILSLQQYLNVERKLIKKFYISSQNRKITNGYKVFYKNTFIKIEISIYENRDKEEVLNDFINIIYMPYFYSIILLILKYMNMILPIPYHSLKKKLINLYKKEPDTYFFVTFENK